MALDRELNDNLIRKFRMKSHLKWGLYRRIPTTSGKIEIWEPRQEIHRIAGGFEIAENLAPKPLKEGSSSRDRIKNGLLQDKRNERMERLERKPNYNLKIWYQRITARRVFYTDPKLYYEIQGIQYGGIMWKRLNAYYIMLKMSKQLLGLKKNLIFQSMKSDFDSLEFMKKAMSKIIGKSTDRLSGTSGSTFSTASCDSIDLKKMKELSETLSKMEPPPSITGKKPNIVIYDDILGDPMDDKKVRWMTEYGMQPIKHQDILKTTIT